MNGWGWRLAGAGGSKSWLRDLIGRWNEKKMNSFCSLEVLVVFFPSTLNMHVNYVVTARAAEGKLLVSARP